MPRPPADRAAMRRRLLDAARACLRESRGARLSVSDIAARCGMSQSNAYRYFRSRGDLLAALAEEWFREIEDALAEVASRPDPPFSCLRAFVLVQLRLKRARFDADPVQFRAYLRLAEEHMDVVRCHTARLHRLLDPIVQRLAAETGRDPAALTGLIEDMTVRFRDPRQIAGSREVCTDERAALVLDTLERALAGPSSGSAAPVP